jgi:hypothetical protein
MTVPESVKKHHWSRLFIKAAGVGAGFAVIVCLVVGCWKWYSSRPKAPKPWNKSAIVATFSDLTTDDNDDIVFYYFVENRTKSDYLPGADTILMFKETKGLREGSGNIGLDPYIFVPPGGRIRVAIHLPGKYSGKAVWINPDERKHLTSLSAEDVEWDKPGTKAEQAAGRSAERRRQNAERTEYYQHPDKFVRETMVGFEGFVAFDAQNKVEIDFPKGW